MPRTTLPPTIKTLDDADRALARLAEIKRAVADKEHALNTRVDFLKESCKKDVDPLVAELAAIEKDLRSYATKHRAEFDPAKSKRLTFGVIGFRSSSSLVVHSVKNTIAAIHRTLADKAETFIRITEKLDKESLEDLDESTLSVIGVTRRETESFYYEVAAEKLT